MTVYDYCHIGHARVMVAFDMVVRWLSQLGYDVNYVRNITDIDDKIIARAIENNEDIGTLTQRFTKAMHDDAAMLGCLSPDAEPRATDHIDEMQQMIATLIEGDYAYAADNGDVYYAVDSFADYGKLSKRKLNEMQAGSRVKVENIKRNPLILSYGKRQKRASRSGLLLGGKGVRAGILSALRCRRNAWAIPLTSMAVVMTCSFRIMKMRLPNLRRQRAASTLITGCTLALSMSMVKRCLSLWATFFTIREVTNKYHPETVRFFLLSSHYRSQVNFSDSALDEAHNSLSRLYNALKIAEQHQSQALEADQELINQAYQSAAGQDFIAAMNDDFNSSAAISVLFSLASEVNKAAKAQDTDKAWQLAQQLRALAKSLNILQQPPKQFLQAVIGKKSENGLSDDAIDALIAERGDAKANKDYARADEIRMQLKEAGIELEDSSAGTTWRRA